MFALIAVLLPLLVIGVAGYVLLALDDLSPDRSVGTYRSRAFK